MRKLSNQVSDFFCALAICFEVTMMVELDHIVRGGRASTPSKGGDHTMECSYDWTSMAQCVRRCCLWKRRYQKMKQPMVD